MPCSRHRSTGVSRDTGASAGKLKPSSAISFRVWSSSRARLTRQVRMFLRIKKMFSATVRESISASWDRITATFAARRRGLASGRQGSPSR